ncbi:MAG: HAMP domain-containing sensor histidine kinase [Victivallales bacterium]|nr:HAMP domain-containing sensor histidine kinase [Victivallales bacterium]
MFWKKDIRIIRTVKFRTARWYALLFAASSMLLFLGIYHLLKASMTAAVDRQLTTLSRQLEDCYVNGEADNIAPPDSVAIPAQIKAAAAARVKGLVIRDAWRERNEHRCWYEIVGTAGKKSYDIAISSDGKVLEVEERIPENRLRQLERKFNREVYYQGVNRIFFRLLAPNGTVLAQSDGRSWIKLARERKDYRRRLPFDQAVTVTVPSRSALRIYEHRLFDGNILETAVNLRYNETILHSYWSVFAVFSSILLLLSAAIGWLLAAKTMKGVERVSMAAAAIGNGNLSRRVESGDEGEEIDELVTAFNHMLAQIEKLIFDLKEVSDNVAHDLRTPLTRIRGIIETTVHGNPTTADYQLMSGEIVEECDRLIGIINIMLEITRTDSGTAQLHIAPLDLTLLARQAYNLFLPLAESKQIDFTLNLDVDRCPINGDRSRLQRMVANLLDNAIKYSAAGGKVTLEVGVSGTQARIIVNDNGCGIGTADQVRVFDRFFRCDSSRSQPGNGLGLSLVQAIVKAHHGTIALHSKPGRGSRFELTFPLAP